MRLQSIDKDGTFREYVETPFSGEHLESVLEDWMEQNPGAIVEDGALLIVGRQVRTNLNSIIDLLALDRDGNGVVIEFKRDRTPRDTLAQALEYASFVEELDIDQLEDVFRTYTADQTASLADAHREFFDLDPSEAVSFNKEQRIVIVGQQVTEEIRQTSRFLRSKGIRATCLEFTFFESDRQEQLLTTSLVVGSEPVGGRRVSAGTGSVTNRAEFTSRLDSNGQSFFDRLFAFAQERGFIIYWGHSGFSMNVSVDGMDVVLCYGYPTGSGPGQCFQSVLFRQGGLLSKTGAPQEEAESFRDRAEATGFFVRGGKETKLVLDHSISDDQMNSVLSWLDSLAEKIREHAASA